MFRRCLLILFLSLFLLPSAYAAEGDDDSAALSSKSEEVSSGSLAGRRLRVFGRGLMNLVSLPFEIPRTIIEERRKRPQGWLLSVLPRTIENVTARGVSAAHDSLIYPVSIRRGQSTEPWSRRFGLPDYPWQTSQVLKPEPPDLPDPDDAASAARFGVRG